MKSLARYIICLFFMSNENLVTLKPRKAARKDITDVVRIFVFVILPILYTALF